MLMQYENEESIYNLIPPEEVKFAKGKRYKSKYNPKIPPTGSTFGNHTTSRVVGNMNGGTDEIKPHRHTGMNMHKYGPKDTNNTANRERKQKMKAAIPKKEDKPIHGLVSDKNFIVANAVENILAAPKVPENKDADMLKKKTYGKVPKYLKTIKREIEDEYQLVQDLHNEEEAQMDQQKFLLPD